MLTGGSPGFHPGMDRDGPFLAKLPESTLKARFYAAWDAVHHGKVHFAKPDNQSAQLAVEKVPIQRAGQTQPLPTQHQNLFDVPGIRLRRRRMLRESRQNQLRAAFARE